VARKGRHEEHEEHENHERWLVSYADFLTLLFAFFVVMYSVSRVDQDRVVEAEKSMRWAMHFEGEGGVSRMAMFDGPPSDGGSIMNLTGGALVMDQQQVVENLRRRIESRIRPFLVERSGRPVVTVLVDGKRVSVRLAAAEFFDAGQSALRPQAVPILDAIATEIVPLRRPLHVEGHTDDSPVGGDRFRDNWELSACRAATVTSYLEQAHGTSPQLLHATGLAATRPASPGTDAASRELNRRIEIVVELDFAEPQSSRRF